MSTPQLVEVKVEQGILRGQRVVSQDGQTYDAFRGIPYAQPPVGPLRFKAPRPPIPWEGARLALKEGPIAPQNPLFSTKVIGDEDCLYLNVYTPRVPSSVATKSPDYKGGSPRPIMVWIHPGGLVSGSGSASEYGPELFLAKDVVIVTLNYRLGALGFLSLGSAAAPGNYGLKDIVAALRWVKANGAVFGGDIDSITVFGCSAGASLVQLLQLSPSAKGLFHKAIAQSGSGLCLYLKCDNPRERAIRLARLLGATDADVKDDASILRFLRRKTPGNILEASTKVITPDDIEAGTTYMFVPVPEYIVPDDPQEVIFLSEHPHDLLKNGPLIDVPLIMGMTDLEGVVVDILFPPEFRIASTPDVLARYEKNLENKGFPLELRYSLPPQKRKEAVHQLRKLFFQGGGVNRNGYYQLQSDLIFNIGILREARIHARKKNNPVYTYVFSVKGRINRMSQVKQKRSNELIGACHADELNYLWNTGPPFPRIPKLDPNSLEARTRERIVTLWTNFAKAGNPTPDGQLVEGIRWPAVPKNAGSSIPYINFDEELTVPPHGAFQERMEFWDSLYSQLE